MSGQIEGLDRIFMRLSRAAVSSHSDKTRKDGTHKNRSFSSKSTAAILLASLILPILLYSICVTITAENGEHEDPITTLLEDNVRRYHQFGVIRMKDNNLLLAYQDNIQIDGNEFLGGIISGKISADNGETWGDNFLIADNTKDGLHANYPGLSVADNGTVVCMFQSRSSAGEVAPLLFCKSYDNGMTWTAAENVDKNNGLKILYINSKIVKKEGVLMAPVNNKENIYLYVSTDNGESWTMRSIMCSKTEFGKTPYYPTITTMENGNILFMCWKAWTDVNWFRISTDDGFTWGGLSEAKDVDGIYLEYADCDLDRVGGCYYVHGRDYGHDGDFTVRTSQNGVTWNSCVFVEEISGEAAYSASEEVNGDLLILFSSDSSAIYPTFFYAIRQTWASDICKDNAEFGWWLVLCVAAAFVMVWGIVWSCKRLRRASTTGKATKASQWCLGGI